MTKLSNLRGGTQISAALKRGAIGNGIGSIRSAGHLRENKPPREHKFKRQTHSLMMKYRTRPT